MFANMSAIEVDLVKHCQALVEKLQESEVAILNPMTRWHLVNTQAEMAAALTRSAAPLPQAGRHMTSTPRRASGDKSITSTKPHLIQVIGLGDGGGAATPTLAHSRQGPCHGGMLGHKVA